MHAFRLSRCRIRIISAPADYGGADIVQILKLALAVTTKETTLRHQFRTHAIFNNTDKMTAMRPLGDDL